MERFIAPDGVAVRPAQPGDMGRVLDLLQQCELPTADIPDDGEGFTVAVDEEGRIVGVAALQEAGDCFLLRSVAVDQHHRGTGTARALCEERLRHAAHAGRSRVYLLTTDAGPYFARLGFCEISRDAAPDGVRATQEFSQLCPDSATFMVHDLSGIGGLGRP